MNERLWNDVEAFLAAESVELDDLDLKGGGKARILKVTVDAEGDLGVGRIADLARGISRLLDEKELVNGPYTLEVTSPGLERKLKRLAHYEKSVGREVVVNTRVPVAGETSHRGILEAAADDGLTMRVGEKTQMIPMGDVSGARTVFQWEAQAKPGRK
jgi:ribosome maturation factor RimP